MGQNPGKSTPVVFFRGVMSSIAFLVLMCDSMREALPTVEACPAPMSTMYHPHGWTSFPALPELEEIHVTQIPPINHIVILSGVA